MGAHPTLRRLLEAMVFSAIAGGITYGLMTWLAPPSISANIVAIIVASVTALAILAPFEILKALAISKRDKSSIPDSYYDASFSIHKDEGWND